MRKHIPVIALAMAALVSCSLTPTEMSTTLKPGNVPAATSTQTKIAAPTVQSTSTDSLAPSPVASAATNATAMPPERILYYQRLAIDKDLPPDATIPGTLILVGQRSYFLDLWKRTRQEIGKDKSCFATSPNRLWLSYCYFSKDSPTGMWLVVESADGQQKNQIAIEQDWWWDIRNIWLDNEHLVYNSWKDKSTTPPIFPVVVVNPFTGEQLQLPSKYPNLKPSGYGPSGTLQFVYSSVVYDPSTKLVIYPQTIDSAFFVVLWDRQANIALARVEEHGIFLHAPLWAPDANQFVVAVGYQEGRNSGEFIEEWIGVRRDGQVSQLTHFGGFFDDARIGSASWSPDGQYLAFWLQVKPSLCDGQQLGVLTTKSQQVTDYCVPGSIDGDAPPPVWSPDSRYIAVQNYYDINASHTILVDIKDGWAAQIADGAHPEAWLATKR